MSLKFLAYKSICKIIYDITIEEWTLFSQEPNIENAHKYLRFVKRRRITERFDVTHPNYWVGQDSTEFIYSMGSRSKSLGLTSFLQGKIRFK